MCVEQNLDLLLKYITNIVEKHTDSEVPLFTWCHLLFLILCEIVVTDIEMVDKKSNTSR